MGPSRFSQATYKTTLSARRGEVNPGKKSSHLDPPLETLGYVVTIDRVPEGQRGLRNRHSWAGNRPHRLGKRPLTKRACSTTGIHWSASSGSRGPEFGCVRPAINAESISGDVGRGLACGLQTRA